FHDALTIVRIHVVGSQANRIGGYLPAAAMVFGHNPVRDRAAGFADIELVWPSARVEEFIFAETELLHLRADVFRHARAGREKVNEAARVVLVFLADARSDRGVAAGILVVHADEIGGETAVVVDVGLAVRHPDRVPKFAELRFLPGGNERF